MRSVRIVLGFGVIVFLVSAPLLAQTVKPQTTTTTTTKHRTMAAATKRPTRASELQTLRETVSAQQQQIQAQQQQIQMLRDDMQKRDAAMQQQLNSLQSSTQEAQSAAQNATSNSRQNEAALAALKTNVATVATKTTETSTSFQAYQNRPPVAGWNGNHFFVQSPDKSFVFEPFGYLQADYRAFEGTAVPVNNFGIRRGRVGFTGKYGKHYSFGFLADFGTSGTGTSGTTGQTTPTAVLRDYYVNAEVVPEVQFKAGQFILPFSQDAQHSAADLEFVERAVSRPLYPGTSTLRSPGVDVRGEALAGRVYYDLGAFNGKGVLTAPTTSTPEGVFRLGLRPWRERKNSVLQGLDVYGAATYGKTRAVGTGPTATAGAGEPALFDVAIEDRVATFFPTLVLNGSLVRADGGLTYTKGPLAVRAEYVQANAARRRLGTGSTDLPGLVGKGYYAQATYVLTGEDRPTNTQPKPRHPFLLGESRGMGAWELGFRYSDLQYAAGTIENRVDQFSSAINWYPTYHVKYTFDVNVDRMKNRFGTLLPQTWIVVLQRVQFRF